MSVLLEPATTIFPSPVRTTPVPATEPTEKEVSTSPPVPKVVSRVPFALKRARAKSETPTWWFLGGGGVYHPARTILPSSAVPAMGYRAAHSEYALFGPKFACAVPPDPNEGSRLPSAL